MKDRPLWIVGARFEQSTFFPAYAVPYWDSDFEQVDVWLTFIDSKGAYSCHSGEIPTFSLGVN